MAVLQPGRLLQTAGKNETRLSLALDGSRQHRGPQRRPGEDRRQPPLEPPEAGSPTEGQADRGDCGVDELGGGHVPRLDCAAVLWSSKNI